MPNYNNNKQEVIHNRSVPYNAEAEINVIGSILIDNSIIDSCIGRLEVESFYDPLNSIIYKAMINVHNDHLVIEYLTVIDELKHLNYDKVDTVYDYLIKCVDSVASTAMVEAYIDIVRNDHVERKLLDTFNGLSNDILNQKYSLNEILDLVENRVSTIVKSRRTTDLILMKDAADDVYETIKKHSGSKRSLLGLDTGFAGLNKTTSGFQPGQLIILAARPSVGKSAYAMNIAMNCARSVNNLDDDGKPYKANVALFSLEMNVEELLTRIYAYEANIDFGAIRNGNLNSDDLLLLSMAREKLKGDINLYFDINPSSNLSDIRTKCRQLKQKGNLDFVIIDYLQLIETSEFGGARHEEVSKISRQLKTLAGELNVPILALSQLSRNIESRSGIDRKPQLSDLRESGSIEQDADIVMFLYRRSDVEGEDVADELNEKVQEQSLTSEEERNKQNDSPIEVVLSIEKNRQGERMDFDYHFYGKYFRFTEQSSFKKLIPKDQKNKNNNNNGMRTITKQA